MDYLMGQQELVKIKRVTLLLFCLSAWGFAELSQPGAAPDCTNPILPGYYADPSIVHFERRAYVYATIDPWGGENLGCWESSDFKNWTFRELNWPSKTACTSPESTGAMVWAPSVVQGVDGRFYMYVSVGSEVWAGSADHPLGPWKNMLADQPLIPENFRPGFHMIDAAAFIDDDGQAYLYWGSGLKWVNGKCWVVKLASDMKTFVGEVKDVTPSSYFEAPFMVKRKGRYVLMYSSGKTTIDTYQVHYAVGDTPFGPFVEAENSPILKTDHTKNVLSPGHHAVFQYKGRDYILYHRHSIPFDQKFVGRQICVDPLEFTSDGFIKTVVPSHHAPEWMQGRMESDRTLTAAAVATASSWKKNAKPEMVLDNNYATRWAADGNEGWLQIDFGEEVMVNRHLIRFEYAWKPYRFRLEASMDGVTWHILEDHVDSPVTGSPTRIEQPDRSRYFRLVFPEDQAGPNPSIFEWNMR